MPHEPLSCVLLADRHHGLAESVRGLLETAFNTVVMVANEASLIEGAVRLRPELAIVDLSLARDSSLGWLKALRNRCPDLRVIVLSIHDEQSVCSAAIKAGADAVVLKRAIATDPFGRRRCHPLRRRCGSFDRRGEASRPFMRVDGVKCGFRPNENSAKNRD